MSAETTFKNIRNRLQRHNAVELLYEFLKLMNRPDALDIERLRHYPLWYLLLLVKWIILHGDFKKTAYQKDASQYHIHELVKRMHGLSEAVPKPSQYKNWLLFLRNMAFQQFWLQEPFTKQRLARQYQLFARLDVNHSFRKEFLGIVGVSIDDFIELSMALLAYFLAKRSMFISANWFNSMRDAYAPNTIENFINAISINLEDARQWLVDIESAKDDREKLINYEFYEQSPFVRYPLIKRDNTYFCISPMLLQHALQTFVYDVLREADAASFMDKFGILFERTVEQSLRSISPQLLLETDLRSYFKNAANQKVVDFLLVDDNNNIFIDAKGVAMSWIGMVTHLPGTVRSQSKSSILKGIEQAYGLAKTLSMETSVGSIQLGNKNNYLLIVTFKDLYVSNGRNFRDLIAPDEIDKIIAKYGNQEWIPLSNIYFISIDDLDILIGCVQQSGQSVSTILEHAVKSDQIPAEMKFVFRQHVFEICPEVDMLPTLKVSLDTLMEQLRKKIDD